MLFRDSTGLARQDWQNVRSEAYQKPYLANFPLNTYGKPASSVWNFETFLVLYMLGVYLVAHYSLGASWKDSILVSVMGNSFNNHQISANKLQVEYASNIFLSLPISLFCDYLTTLFKHYMQGFFLINIPPQHTGRWSHAVASPIIGHNELWISFSKIIYLKTWLKILHCMHTC